MSPNREWAVASLVYIITNQGCTLALPFQAELPAGLTSRGYSGSRFGGKAFIVRDCKLFFLSFFLFQ